jgi:hypothetical protein
MQKQNHSQPMQTQNHSQPMQVQNHSQPMQTQNHSQPVQVQNHSQPMQDRVILNHACNCRVIFNPFKYRVILNLCKYHRNSPPSPGAFWIYILSFCPPLVRMCYGCRASLKPSGHILPPPHDLVVVSNMLREYLKTRKCILPLSKAMCFQSPALLCTVVVRNKARN